MIISLLRLQEMETTSAMHAKKISEIAPCKNFLLNDCTYGPD